MTEGARERLRLGYRVDPSKIERIPTEHQPC